MDATETTAAPYEAPRLTRIGSVQERTLLQNKYYASITDYNYPAGLKFNFS